MIKNAILITIILHSFILIGIPEAHGYGFMIFTDLISIASIFRNLVFSESIDYNLTIILMGLISFFGKVMLITSLFSTKKKNYIFRVAGLIFLFISWIILFYYNWDFGILTIITLGFSIPFLMYFGRVIYWMIKATKN